LIDRPEWSRAVQPRCWRLKTAKFAPLPVHSRTRRENIDVTDVLKAAGMSRSTLERRYARTWSSKIRILRFRLNRAKNCW